jgi:hypothetical protein
VAARPGRVRLRSISPDATPEEVAAITAAIAASTASGSRETGDGDPGDESSRWVQAARLTGRRGSYSRGEWRLSGRLGRRSRA